MVSDLSGGVGLVRGMNGGNLDSAQTLGVRVRSELPIPLYSLFDVMSRWSR